MWASDTQRNEDQLARAYRERFRLQEGPSTSCSIRTIRQEVNSSLHFRIVERATNTHSRGWSRECRVIHAMANFATRTERERCRAW